MLPIIATLVQQLRSFQSVDKVILFGSRARGDDDPRSDIDLSVACPRAPKEEWLKLEALIEQADTLYFIDLVRLDKASKELKNKILKEGKILYERGESETIVSSTGKGT